MGILFCANKPPENFVGVWTNGDTVRMRVWKSGTINYIKEVCSDLEDFCLQYKTTVSNLRWKSIF